MLTFALSVCALLAGKKVVLNLTFLVCLKLTLYFFIPVRMLLSEKIQPSILSIKEKLNNNVFYFRKVTQEEILNEINNLDMSKSTQSEDIPFKIIKDNADTFANFILQNFSKCIIA